MTNPFYRCILKYTEEVVDYGILLTFIDSGELCEKHNPILMTSVYFCGSLCSDGYSCFPLRVVGLDVSKTRVAVFFIMDW